MRLKPNYSYDFNVVLNPELKTEEEQIKNFASIISDKDRFLNQIGLIEKNKELIEKTLGYKLKEEVEFYVVRCEKFKSFSMPITIEYSILPEDMIVFLLKEIIKTSVEDRFLNTLSQEQYTNAVVDFLVINGDWNELNLIKFTKNVHEESKKKLDNYELIDVDFNEKNLRDYIYDFYEN